MRLLLSLLLLGGCAAYDPPMKGDHAAAKYQSDLGRCRKQAHVVAEQIAGATPGSEIRSLFTSSEPEHQDVRACMTARGYGL